MKDPALLIATAGLALAAGGVVYSAGIQAARIESSAKTLDRHEAMLATQNAVHQQQLTDQNARLDTKLDRLNERLDALLRMLAESERKQGDP